MSMVVEPDNEIASGCVSLDFLMRAIGAELSGLESGRLSPAECRDRIAVLVQAGLALIELEREPGRSRSG